MSFTPSVFFLILKGISKNSLYPSLLEKGEGLRLSKARFLEMPLSLFIVLIFVTDISAQSTEVLKDDVWQKELEYWRYVKNNDTAAYRKLWHDNFIGYPETERLTGKDKIANWVTDAHNTKGRHYEFLLVKKIVNPFGDVVITFYDETDTWTNDKNEVLVEQVFKITHTWKKFGDSWPIIGDPSQRSLASDSACFLPRISAEK